MRTTGTYFLEPPTPMLSTPMRMMTMESGYSQRVDHFLQACGATMLRCGHDDSMGSSLAGPTSA